MLSIVNKYGDKIQLNEEQERFVTMALSGQSMCLLGSAGTGKTTVVQAFIKYYVQKYNHTFVSNGHSKLVVSGTPPIVACAFTRTAVNNIKQALSYEMQANAVTIHGLLEFAPYVEEYEDEHGMVKTRKIFKERRNRGTPLDSSISVLIIEEASMVSVELYSLILEAIQHKIQIIFLGDINQLPPVFGSAILGYAMLHIPTVELKEVYRNAGAIVNFAHDILTGKPIPHRKFKEYEVPNKVILQAWKNTFNKDVAVRAASALITSLIDMGEHDINRDIVLCPFNVSFGTDRLNEVIANHISKKNEEPTFEIIAGFNKRYLAVGDRVMYRKELGTITSIERNLTYIGKAYQAESVHMDRCGCNQEHATKEVVTNTVEDIDKLLEGLHSVGDSDEALSRRQCSHIIEVKLDTYGEQEERLEVVDTTAKINELILAYAITVHKSQGSEWRKVRLLLHKSHARNLNREMLYTAVTRAKETVHILCEKDSLVKAILSQAIRGNTLEEKAEVFKGKVCNENVAMLRFS